MTTPYNLKNIRTLLTSGFTAANLRTFCFEHSDFRPIHDQLAETTGKAEIVQRLVEYADQQELFEPLLAWAKRQNPAKYEQHQPYHSPTISSGDHGKSERTTTIPVPQNASFSIKQAVKALDSPNPAERKNGINTIAQSDDPTAFEVLLSAMCDHPTKQVRGSALDALWLYHNDTRAIPALINLLDDWNFHTTASLMLAGFGKSALPNLLNALHHENPKIRYSAATILGDIGGDQTAQNLIEALHDKDSNVRCGAAEALGKLKEPAAISALAAILSDTEKPEWTDHQRVCDAAALALQNIGTSEAMDARKKHFG